MLNLTPITVAIDDLLLDPNNPRLVTDLNSRLDIPDEEVEQRQTDLLKRFSREGEQRGEDDEFFSIEGLMTSMTQIGYVGIDRIVVRKGPGGKYIVLEGNRRTATIKTLRRQNDEAPANKKLPSHVVETFEMIGVMELPSDGLSHRELRDRLNVILGLRHYGSLLEWDPLPKAYNMFHNYIGIDPPLQSFTAERKRINEVASRLSIKPAKVQEALRTYIAYLQLSEDSTKVRDDYYSLIQAAITNRNIVSHGYLRIDDNSYELDEPSKQRLSQLCQFETRTSLRPEQIIVRRPQDMKLVGDIVKKSHVGQTEAIRNYADALLRQVETGEVDGETGKLALSLDAAVSALNDFESRAVWVNSVDNLLKKQEAELEVAQYRGIGNDLLQKENLEQKFENIRFFFSV